MNAPNQPHTRFDAHLDLASLAVLGRDMKAPLDPAAGPHPPAAVTLPELREARVTRCLGTIFTEADGKEPAVSYTAGDAEAAYFVGVEQLNTYHHWQRDGFIKLPTDHQSHADRDHPTTMNPPPAPSQTLSLGVLIEGADPILDPDHLSWWAGRGVVAIGMAWWKPSRYAAGNGTEPGSPNDGLSDLGRRLVKEIDRLDLVHDLSHLSQRAADELLDAAEGRVMASHSNCRALLENQDNPAWQRHLSDEQIKAIANRDGVIGLNLVRNFIRHGLNPNAIDRPSIAEAADHTARICDLTGSARHIGWGTDLDGGISASDLPDGINTPRDMPKLEEELAARGFSEEDLAAFRENNWRRMFPML